MAWIELHQTIWTHRKTLKLASMLELKEIYAAAHVIKLWTWAIDNAKDGRLTDIPRTSIAKVSEWDGNAEDFVEALINSGWLDNDENGVKIHDWYDYAGRLIEKRQEEAERKKRAREEKKQESGRPKTVRRTSSGQSKDVHRNRTVPNHTVNHTAAPARANEVEPELPDNNPNITIVDVHTQVFGDYVVNGMMNGFIQELLNKGKTDFFVKELMLETGENANKPSLKYMRMVAERWLNEGINSRDEAKRKMLKNNGPPEPDQRVYVLDENDPITKLMRRADAPYAEHRTT